MPRGFVAPKPASKSKKKNKMKTTIQKPLWQRVGLNGRPLKSQQNRYGSKFWGKNRRRRDVNQNSMVPKLTSILNSTNAAFLNVRSTGVTMMKWLNADIKPRFQKITGMKATKQMIMQVVMPGLERGMRAMPSEIINSDSFVGWDEKFDCYMGKEQGIDWIVEVKCYESNSNNPQVGFNPGIGTNNNLSPTDSPNGNSLNSPNQNNGKSSSDGLKISILLALSLIMMR